MFFFTCFKSVIENPCKSLQIYCINALFTLSFLSSDASTTQNKYYQKYMQ